MILALTTALTLQACTPLADLNGDGDCNVLDYAVAQVVMRPEIKTTHVHVWRGDDKTPATGRRMTAWCVLRDNPNIVLGDGVPVFLGDAYIDCPDTPMVVVRVTGEDVRVR